MITVRSTDGSNHQYANASGWHVDEQGDLHIRKTGNGNVATHARERWASVADVPTPEVTTTTTVQIDGKQVAKTLSEHMHKTGRRGLGLG